MLGARSEKSAAVLGPDTGFIVDTVLDEEAAGYRSAKKGCIR